MAFKDIIGNHRIKKILKRSLKKDKIPNSLLFCGPEGAGKKETALVLAKAMNCLKKKGDACEICSSCKAINSGNFPDVMTISPENDSLKIKQMRDLKHLAYLKPMIAKKRIFIIEEAEKMGNEAANSFLKVLDEPPLSSYFILITHNFYVILPTIKSRCQTLTFSQVSSEEAEDYLVDKGYDRERARIIAFLVRGNLREALTLDWDEFQAQREEAWKLLLSFLKNGKTSAFLEKFHSQRKSDLMKNFTKEFEIFSSFCRDLILIKEKGDDDFLMNPDYKDELVEVEGIFDLDKLMEFLRKIDFVLYGMNMNLNFNLLMSSTFSDLMEWSHV